jgi:TonB family protein
MNARAILLLICIAPPSLAQNAQKPIIAKSEIQVRAESLMDRARNLSDIRAKGAPAFRLELSFSFAGKNLDMVQGTYTEIWVSKSQWRRETIAGADHRIEVRNSAKQWLLDNTKDFPETASRLPDLMNLFPAGDLTFDFEHVDDSPDHASQCAITKAGYKHEKYAFCFDKKNGALFEKVAPVIRPMNAVNYSCLYDVFRKFGDFWFPREMNCDEEKHRKLDAKVEELALDPSPDPDLFKSLPGAIEHDECSGTKRPPRPASTPEPRIPLGLEYQGIGVTLSLVVNQDGKPRDIRVARSGGKPFDDQAITAVSHWRFKPATCDGQPISTQVALELYFHH